MMVATIGAFALASRVEMLQGKVQADGAQAQEIARAGIEYAMARLADPHPQRRWAADGRTYAWSFAGASVELRIVDESGKVDINHADPALLAALLYAVGAEPSAAQQLAGAIVDWRDPDSLTQPGGGAEDPAYAAAGRAYGAKDAPFQSVAELHQVLGMTPELFVGLAPHLTVFSGLSRPNAEFASAPVRAALGLDTARIGQERRSGQAIAGTGTYSIESHATLADGREAVLRATVRRGGAVPGAAYAVMRWETGTLAR
ncbi:general secretion pathway protein GspK [Pseudoxanthomonas suwonensis]|uniref:General secretion pathway protein GspK n=1 Tax=Pseudoxanthomonas suwonensis TaxID=314722 RepID=A0A0E3UPY1_9GAMM|nr:type II secretion system protein GspK [Pseudoxanthomonas suwonensis]AKC88456.1 general secretion pathway protein GspK [Pseudoxanthomonas suwonensis]